MENKECRLQMNELFFSKFDFSQTHEDDNSDYETSFEIEYAVSRKDCSRYRVTIKSSIKNKTESVHINLDTVGVFTVDDEGISAELGDHLIKVNTVAIMFPFIRSQISLLTTQPGFKPVLLPPININALINSDTDNEED